MEYELQFSRVVGPMEQCLSLLATAAPVAGQAVGPYLRRVPPEGPPPSDLPRIVGAAPSHVVAAIPLKPAARVFMIEPALRSPDRKRLRRIDAEVVQRRVVAFGAKFRILEPVRREFGRAIGHITAAEHTKRKHLLRRQLRAEVGVEVAARRFGQSVDIALLHQVIDLDLVVGHCSLNVDSNLLLTEKTCYGR